GADARQQAGEVRGDDEDEETGDEREDAATELLATGGLHQVQQELNDELAERAGATTIAGIGLDLPGEPGEEEQKERHDKNHDEERVGNRDGTDVEERLGIQ